MKRTVLLLLIIALGFLANQYLGSSETALPASGEQDTYVEDGNSRIAEAFAKQQSDVQVLGAGVVSRILSDDNEGSRHQRFIVELASGQTVLISHNIDLAPRVDALQIGDQVTFHGEYEWNPQGGVVHWTHHDPAGRHVGGWVEHAGQRYE